MPKQDPKLENLIEVIDSNGDPGVSAGHDDTSHFDIRIARDGTWYHRGAPIRRLALAKLFATVLNRRQDGSFWLTTPAESGRIEVEDAPFTAVAMTVTGEGSQQVLRFRTNLDEEVDAGRDHPIHVLSDDVSGAPRPYVEVRGGLEALVLRPIYYDMVALAVERDIDGARMLGVWSGGVFFPIGPVPV